MEILFWVSAFFVLYPYAGYPLLLWLLGDVRRVYARTLTALHAIEVEDAAVVVLAGGTSARATLTVAKPTPPPTARP